MSLEERGKHQRLNSHELDENVERWARSVLEWVTNSVTNDSCLVGIRSLASQLTGMLSGASLRNNSMHSQAYFTRHNVMSIMQHWLPYGKSLHNTALQEPHAKTTQNISKGPCETLCLHVAQGLHVMVSCSLQHY